MAKICIIGADILTMTGKEDIITNGEIAIEDDKIVFIGGTGSIPKDFEADKEIDGAGMVVMPGLINCHTHAAMTLLRGYADDLPLMEWLNKKIWPFEAKLTAEDIYYGSLLATMEMIKSGTTTFADMYFIMDQTAKAVEKSGMRGVLSRGLIGLAPDGKEKLKENIEFVRQYQGRANGRITTMLGPHAPYTCPPEYLTEVIKAADDLGVGMHIHLAETQTEYQDILKQYGKSPIAHVESLGLFEHPTLAAHCVHVTDEDIAILAQHHVGVAHNPESNMKLASGIAPVNKMIAVGIPVGLGTDGASSNNNLDMMEEMHTAALLHKVSNMDPTVLPAYQALKMATTEGARALGMEKKIGQLKVGMQADLMMVDFQAPHLIPRHDIAAHLVYSANSADVQNVIIAGEMVMEDRQLLTLDEEKIYYGVMQCMNRLLA